MALIAATSHPFNLLAAIQQAIDSLKVSSWTYDKHNHFTPSGSAWRHKANFKPHAEPGRLVFGLVSHPFFGMSHTVWAAYHGLLTEMLCCHFSPNFSRLEVSASYWRPYDVPPA